MKPDYSLGNCCNKEIEYHTHTTYWVRCALPLGHFEPCRDIPRNTVSYGRTTLQRAEVSYPTDANGAPL
jgi:hypothetical protein